MGDYELDEIGVNAHFSKKKLLFAFWVVITILGLGLIASAQHQVKLDHEAQQAGRR